MSPQSDVTGDTPALSLRERGKRRRTERILDAALELLRENPDQNLTVERIASRAEVAPMTVFNLVGNRDQLYSTLADRALRDFDVWSIKAPDPQERARRIVQAVVKTLCADAPVFRALLSGWSHSGRVLELDPTEALIGCLREAAEAGQISPEANLRRHGEVLSTGVIGAIAQWSAGILSDRALRARARAVVDIVFAAARSGEA